MSISPPALAPAQAAATYLRELLLRPGRPRRAWEQYSERARANHINGLAVAEVLAQYLWLHPRKAGDDELLARQLKDTVSRALSGKLLSRATLELFVEAFAFSDSERDHLWRLWEGSPNVRMLAGSHAVRSEAEEEVVAFLGPPGHQTLSLHDHVDVGSDRRIARVRTIQVIEAIRHGLDSIPYMYDTSALTLQTVHGCVPPAARPAQVAEGVFVTRLPLARTLGVGDTLTLEYATTFHYRDELTEEQREYRRAVMRRVENLDLRVQFDADAIPPMVWRAVWNGVEGEVEEQSSIDLDSEHAAHLYLRLAEKTVTGFHWSWLARTRIR